MLFRLEKAEMDKLYNKAFNFGVLFNVLLFSVLNFLSYVVAYWRYLKYGNVDSQLADVGGFPSWGFPLAWGQGTEDALNFVILAFCGFVFGFLFRFVWSKISSRPSPLK